MKKFKFLLSLIAIVLCVCTFSITAFAESVPVYFYADTNGDKQIDIRDLVHAFVEQRQGSSPSAADWDFDGNADFDRICDALLKGSEFKFSIDSNSFEAIF